MMHLFLKFLTLLLFSVSSTVWAYASDSSGHSTEMVLLHSGIQVCNSADEVRQLLASKEREMRIQRRLPMIDGCMTLHEEMHATVSLAGLFESEAITADILLVILFSEELPGAFVPRGFFYGYSDVRMKKVRSHA